MQLRITTEDRNDYPRLKAVNLVDAWAFAEEHPLEITAQIYQNEVA